MAPFMWSWEKRHPVLRVLVAFCLATGTLLVLEMWDGKSMRESLTDAATTGGILTYIFFVFPWPFRRKRS